MTSTKTSRPRKWLIGLVLAALSIGAALFVLEVGVRLLPPPYDQNAGDFYVCDNILGWRGTPNFEGIIGSSLFEQRVTYNSLGMHDTDHSLEKPADVIRIVMLGDSFVQAVQVAEAATSHQVLEDYLNHTDTQQRYEVISSGVINWGTNQQLIYYREVARRFQPDVVLLMFYLGNDFLDNLPGNALTIGGRNCYAPYFTVCDETLDPSPLAYAPGVSQTNDVCATVNRTWINALGWLYQHSHLYQQLEPLIVANRPRRLFGEDFSSAFSALYLPVEEATLTQARQVTQATIAQLKAEVEADGGTLAVALISPDIVVRLTVLSPAEQAVFLRDNAVFAQADIDRPTQQLLTFLAEQHIPSIDLTPLLSDYLAEHGTPLYILGEGHWTADGNRVAGERLGEWLLKTISR